MFKPRFALICEVCHSLSLALLLCLPLSLSPPAWSWGQLGHEVVCLIAFEALTSVAKKEVTRLNKSERSKRFKSFGRACTWADERGKVQKKRKTDHYINVPRHWVAIKRGTCVMEQSCLFSAIENDLQVLVDTNEKKYKRWQALKFLGHWVGDIHQPLHVSFQDDRGGNLLYVQSQLLSNGMRKLNLHAVWDGVIPMYAMQKRGIYPSKKHQYHFAKALSRSITKNEQRLWSADLKPWIWANESLQLSRLPELRYCMLSGDLCQYSRQHEQFKFGSRVREIDLPPGYREQWAPMVETRLKMAGIRLAALLNSIFK